jgi:hypothetical protein
MEQHNHCSNHPTNLSEVKNNKSTLSGFHRQFGRFHAVFMWASRIIDKEIKMGYFTEWHNYRDRNNSLYLVCAAIYSV